jgi:hypothetical protein
LCFASSKYLIFLWSIVTPQSSFLLYVAHPISFAMPLHKPNFKKVINFDTKKQGNAIFTQPTTLQLINYSWHWISKVSHITPTQMQRCKTHHTMFPQQMRKVQQLFWTKKLLNNNTTNCLNLTSKCNARKLKSHHNF